jgi:hypothetical protein
MLQRRTLLAVLPTAIAATHFGRPAAAAAPLPAPVGKILLTVRGKIAITNSPGAAQFDLAMLDALPQGRFDGETPWTKGRTVFTGPLGSALLDAVGADGAKLRVTALNDYSADVPVADLRAHAVILATRREGAPMAVRDNGPIWVMYPMDKEPSLRVESTYTRSVWQVEQIEVL